MDTLRERERERDMHTHTHTHTHCSGETWWSKYAWNLWAQLTDRDPQQQNKVISTKHNSSICEISSGPITRGYLKTSIKI
jgi:hypothetical protein